MKREVAPQSWEEESRNVNREKWMSPIHIVASGW